MLKSKSIRLHPNKLQKKRAQEIFRKLEKAYGQPVWKTPVTPLDELMLTILSQNTNDRNRDLAFQNLKRSFPEWGQVKDAPLNDVVSSIRSAGLGNQKGARMQAILRQISEENGSLDIAFLSNMDADRARQWLMRFKGVGPKTASIVMQFALHHPAFPVDTHIFRISRRLGLRPEKLSAEKTHAWMEELFKPEQYGSAHLNLIRLGREICHARKPACGICPLQEKCPYFLKVMNKK